MKIRVTVLSENSVFSNLGAIAEHGWSVFLETEHGNFLFDTGQGKALLNNANVFHKDLSSIQGIILSHHHIDHTGGLWDALKMTTPKPVPVYAHPGIFNESYLARSDYKFFCGLPYCRSTLESAGAKFNFNTEFEEISPGLYLTGEIPRVTPYEQGDDDMFLKNSDGFVKDQIWDDQSVIVKTEKGLLVILGCAHAGIINILTYAQQKTGEKRIHAIIGGTHLGPVSREQKEKSLNALADMNIDRIGVSHCTGFEMSMRLAQLFGEKYFNCNVGTVIEA